MALFSLPEARSAARLRYPTIWTKTAGGILNEAVKSVPLDATFDIFLSHSYADARVIKDEELLGVKALLEKYQYSVYVDWLVDRQLSRENVTKETAEVLRRRMLNCRSLLFVATTNASHSKWMPWELGYMDGKKGTAAVLPVTDQQTTSDAFKGQEYLGIYPYVTNGTLQGTGADKLWVHYDPTVYVLFDNWLTGTKPFKHNS